jgi:hypothetical protein
MAGKIQLKLKPKAPAAAVPTAAPASGAVAPMFAPATSSGGLVIELRGASVHVAEVIIKKK